MKQARYLRLWRRFALTLALSACQTEKGSDAIICDSEGADAQVPCEATLDQIQGVTLNFSGASETVTGQPFCNGCCGYRYEANANENFIFDPVLKCPLQKAASCDQTRAGLKGTAPCTADIDCELLTGVTTVCESLFREDVYFSSSQLSEAEQKDRKALALEYKAGGCGTAFRGFDGPVNKVACVEGECALKTVGACGFAPALDAGTSGQDL